MFRQIKTFGLQQYSRPTVTQGLISTVKQVSLAYRETIKQLCASRVERQRNLLHTKYYKYYCSHKA